MVGLAMLGGLARPVAAQNGALYLLMPFGARAVGQGEAVVADTTLGSEAIWWNPAALARMARSDLALHHGQTVIANSDMLTFTRPSRVLGTLAASAYIVNYGDQQATDVNGQPAGTITNRNYQFALSYASTIGKRLSAGLTYKFAMFRCQLCTVDQPTVAGSTSALDLGAQYAFPTTVPVSVGLSVRNLGPALQVKDVDQADPLPRVIQLGLRVQVPSKVLAARKTSVDIEADVVNAPALQGTVGGVGVNIAYDRQLFVRAGYRQQPGLAKGPSLGFGYERQGFGVDLAQRYDALSTQSGKSSTYFTLRARF